MTTFKQFGKALLKKVVRELTKKCSSRESPVMLDTSSNSNLAALFINNLTGGASTSI